MRLLPVVAAVLGLLVQTQQKPPLIRSRITIVPIDVRVVDRDGRPVTGLTREDFVVLEDGVPQEIKVFTPHAFTPDPSAATPSGQPELRRTADESMAASNRRVFLLMAGRGRHQVVSKYVDEMSAFVSAMLPQDLAAFMAWNRSTAFTGDRAKLGAVLASYRDRHEEIEADLRNWFSGLRAVYGSKEIPARIQAKIDAVFGADPSLMPRTVTPSAGADARAIAARANAAEIQRDEILKERPRGESLPDTRAEIVATLGGMSFEDYIGQASETFQDVGALYSAIEYMRYLDGEKHVVYLTERGIYLPLLAGNNHLARIASDARIALNIIQTGGVVGAPPPTRYGTQPVPSSAAVARQTFAIQDLRDVTETTGGRLAAFKHADQAFNTLASGLGFQYVLGYAPAREATDGRFRKIEIKVRRPGVAVHHRRGYFASPEIVPLDRREFVAFSRIRAAQGFTRPINDIRLTVEGASLSSKTLTVRLRIGVSNLMFAEDEGSRVADLDVGILVTNHDKQTVGELIQRVDLRFTPELFARAVKEGTVVSFTLPLTGAAADLKAVVYDYRADRLGTIQGNLR